MLRTALYKTDTISLGDTVAICRDGSGWLSPAHVTKIKPYSNEVVQNGRLKTFGINCTRIIQPSLLTSTQVIETDRDFNHVHQHGNDRQDDDGDDIELNRNDPRNNEADSGNLPRRIRQAEVRRVLADTQTDLGKPLAETRSQTIADHNNEVHGVHDAEDAEDTTTLLYPSIAIAEIDSPWVLIKQTRTYHENYLIMKTFGFRAGTAELGKAWRIQTCRRQISPPSCRHHPLLQHI